jgi:hypothetical protein
MAHGMPIELGQERQDRTVQLGQGEEAAVAEPGQDPTFDHLHRDLDLGFVAGLAHAGRHDGGAEVAGHLLLGRVDPGYGERSPERQAQRNGYRDRVWETRAGTVELRIPKLRKAATSRAS